MNKGRRAGGYIALIGVLLSVFLFGLTTGKYPLSLAEVVDSLVSGGSQARPADRVVWQLRLPRLVAAIFVGSALAGAGATYQAMFRNPLVSPDILGVSAGAGLGAVLGIYLAWPLAGIQMLAFLGGLSAVAAVYLVSLSSRRYDPVLVLVLAGVAVSTLLGAGISLIKIIADPYTQLPSITFWLLGGLNAVNQNELLHALPFLMTGLIPIFLLRWRVNLLSLDELEAQSLGVRTQRLRLALIVCATLMTAAAVSFTGIIGWVGLVIPHMARLVVGPEFSRLLPTSLLLGAIFLLLTDTFARTAASMELPLGVVTALIGAPFFLYLLLRGTSSRHA